jgi:predicted PhzF superfamily epimerase YddE/YHI9
VVQECGVGLVTLRRDGARLAFAAPALRRSLPEPALLQAVLAALCLQPAQVLAAQLLDNGPQWLSLLLDSPHTVMAVQPDHAALKVLGQKVGLASVEYSDVATLLIARSNREARAFGSRADAPAEPGRTSPHCCATLGAINERTAAGMDGGHVSYAAG